MSARVLLSIALVAASAAPARAGSDYRWHDRFFWGLSGGAVAVAEGAPREGAGGFEVSYWPEDHVGVRIGWTSSAFADDWGVDLVAAVPLRYVQLYGGLHLGLRNVRGLDEGDDAVLYPLVGAQAYLGRNGRLFVEWVDAPVEPLRLGSLHADTISGGLRWSPDFFHRAHPLNKIDMVYCATWMTFLVWGIASAAQ
jgi:hypothetical protein